MARFNESNKKNYSQLEPQRLVSFVRPIGDLVDLVRQQQENPENITEKRNIN